MRHSYRRDRQPSLGLPLFLLLLATTLAAAGCGRAKGRTEIPTYQASRGEFRISVTESGELKAKESIVIYAPRTDFGSVQIVEIVPEGTRVQTGDFLIQFDTTEPQKRIDETVARLEILQADMRKLQTDQAARIKDLQNQLINERASLEMTELKQARMRFEAEAVQREVELEVTRARLAVVQAEEKIETQGKGDVEDLRKQSLQIQQAQSELAQARKNFEELRVTAPAPGLAVYRKNWATDAKMRVGDNPWPGMPLIELPNLSQMIAETQINEVDVSKIVEGQEAIVSLDAFPDRSFPAKVTSIATLATEKERRSSVKVFVVETALEASDPIMKPGMTVKVEVVVERIPGVLSIPLEAIFEKGPQRICHVRQDGSFEERQVKLGRRNEDFVVVEEGLQEGERVALRDPNLPLEAIGVPEEQDQEKKEPEGGSPAGPPPGRPRGGQGLG